MTATKALWVALALLTILRLVFAASMPLTPDETYYWVWSRHLQGGYLDHPFMVALWIRIGTWIAGDTPLGVRLLGPVSALLGSWLLFGAARALVTSRGWPVSGVRAVLILNATLMLGLGSATMTPDTPLLFFVTLMLRTVAEALAARHGAARLGWWLTTGFALGLGFDSKYTAALTGISLAGFILSDARKRWKEAGPWCAIPVVIVTISPVVWWNRSHHWASFLKQGGRTADWHPARALQFLGELLGGQIGLATPLLFVLFTVGAWRALRSERFLAWLIIVPVGVFVVHAVGDRVQANWPAVVYPALALAAAATTWRIRWAVGTGFVLTALVMVQAVFAPVPLSAHRDPMLRQTAGWGTFAQALAIKARASGAQALIAPDYALASELAFSQHILPVIGVDMRWSLFGFPQARAALGWRVTELRHGEPSGVVSCRQAGGRIVRCYDLQPVQDVQGTRLPSRG